MEAMLGAIAGSIIAGVVVLVLEYWVIQPIRARGDKPKPANEEDARSTITANSPKHGSDSAPLRDTVTRENSGSNRTAAPSTTSLSSPSLKAKIVGGVLAVIWILGLIVEGQQLFEDYLVRIFLAGLTFMGIGFAIGTNHAELNRLSWFFILIGGGVFGMAITAAVEAFSGS